MTDQIEEEVKEERRARLMELQQEIAFEKAQGMVGKTLTVMIEGRLEEEGVYVARSYKDAPNVDGLVFVHAEENLISGDFGRVEITASHDYDLIGKWMAAEAAE